MTKEDGTPIGNQRELVSCFYGEYSYKPFLDLFDIHTQLDSINLLNITNAQIKYAAIEPDEKENLVHPEPASATWVYDSAIEAYNEKKLKAINKALKAIDKLIRESRNPWFQHIQAVNDYYLLLDIYKVYVEIWMFWEPLLLMEVFSNSPVLPGHTEGHPNPQSNCFILTGTANWFPLLQLQI